MAFENSGNITYTTSWERGYFHHLCCHGFILMSKWKGMWREFLQCLTQSNHSKYSASSFIKQHYADYLRWTRNWTGCHRHRSLYTNDVSVQMELTNAWSSHWGSLLELDRMSSSLLWATKEASLPPVLPFDLQQCPHHTAWSCFCVFIWH
jgi:hypothetical protein